MATTAWKEDRVAVLCCMCGERGPASDCEQTARNVAMNTGWFGTGQRLVPIPEAKLVGSTHSALSMSAGVPCTHSAELVWKKDYDIRWLCPSCILAVRDRPRLVGDAEGAA